MYQHINYFIESNIDFKKHQKVFITIANFFSDCVELFKATFYNMHWNSHTLAKL